MRNNSTYRIHCLLLITLGLLTAVADQSAAQRLLIDDFSIDQQGIETDQNAAFDLLEDARLFGGGREIWGGGASVDGNCENATMAVTVNDGTFQIINSPGCYGGGAMTWPSRRRDATFDLDRYSQIQLDVAAIEGEVLTRVTVLSNVSGSFSFDVSLTVPGLNTFDLPNNADLSRAFHDCVHGYPQCSNQPAAS